MSFGCRISWDEDRWVDRGGALGSESAGVRTRIAAAPTLTLRRLLPFLSGAERALSIATPPHEPGPLPTGATKHCLEVLGCSLDQPAWTHDDDTTMMRARLLTVAVFAALLAVATCQDTEHPELEQCKAQVSREPRACLATARHHLPSDLRPKTHFPI